MLFWKDRDKLKKSILIIFSIAFLAAVFSFSTAGKDVVNMLSQKLGLSAPSPVIVPVSSEQPLEPVYQEPQNNSTNIAAENGEANASSVNPDVQTQTNTETQENPAENPPRRNAELIIGAMADSHATSKTYWMIGEFAKKAKLEQVDFVVEAGDFIENRVKDGGGKQPREDGLRDWRIADGYLYNNLGGIPEYHVVGNHEMFSLLKEDWENLIGNKSYYSFKVKDHQIIVLDTSYFLNGNDIELDNEKEGAYPGSISEKELDWLEEKVKNHKKNIIFCHHPLYLLRNSNKVSDLLKNYEENIILIVSGHKHRARQFTYEGIKYVDMPALDLQRQYAIIEINGGKAKVDFLNL